MCDVKFVGDDLLSELCWTPAASHAGPCPALATPHAGAKPIAIDDVAIVMRRPRERPHAAPEAHLRARATLGVPSLPGSDLRLEAQLRFKVNDAWQTSHAIFDLAGLDAGDTKLVGDVFSAMSSIPEPVETTFTWLGHEVAAFCIVHGVQLRGHCP